MWSDGTPCDETTRPDSAGSWQRIILGYNDQWHAERSGMLFDLNQQTAERTPIKDRPNTEMV